MECRTDELKESEEAPEICQKSTLCRTCIHAVPTIDACDARESALICDLTVASATQRGGWTGF